MKKISRLYFLIQNYLYKKLKARNKGLQIRYRATGHPLQMVYKICNVLIINNIKFD